MVLGHEAAGEVLSMRGAGCVTDFVAGDHVVPVYAATVLVRRLQGRTSGTVRTRTASLSGGRRRICFRDGWIRASDGACLTVLQRRGGVTTVSAGLHIQIIVKPAHLVNIVAEERTVKGSYIGSCVPARDVPRFIDLYQRGKLPVDMLMSDRMSLQKDINLGFDRLTAAHTVRQIVVMNHGRSPESLVTRVTRAATVRVFDGGHEMPLVEIDDVPVTRNVVPGWDGRFLHTENLTVAKCRCVTAGTKLEPHTRIPTSR